VIDDHKAKRDHYQMSIIDFHPTSILIHLFQDFLSYFMPPSVSLFFSEGTTAACEVNVDVNDDDDDDDVEVVVHATDCDDAVITESVSFIDSAFLFRSSSLFFASSTLT